MSEFRADLHCHSTCSDGSLTPTEIVQLAKKKGLSGISITDHDSIEAYATAIPACAELGIELLTGVELSTVLNGVSIHILAYGFQPDDKEMLAFCQRHAERRFIRNQAILALLEKHGMPLSQQDLAAPSLLPRTIGRPHIALAMVQKGYVASLQEAFKKYLGDGRPCHTQGASFSIEETIEVIRRSHALSVIAHPHLLTDQKILNSLLEMPFDGIECYYGKFQSENHKRWLKIAEKKGWLVTGGSDFHGDIKPAVDLGCSWIDARSFSSHKRPFIEVISKVRLAAFRRFCQDSAFCANPLLSRVCGFAQNAESWQNHPKIGKIGTSAITSKKIKFHRMPSASYQQLLGRLLQVNMQGGMKLGLDNCRRLDAALGMPSQAFPLCMWPAPMAKVLW